MRLCWLFLWVAPLFLRAESDEEALFLRRIADFWQEGEYQIAKSQMEEFIAEFPESSFSDALCAALGDLYLREKNFSHALDYYTRLQTPEFCRRSFLNRMHCLYEMQWYATLADECEEYLQNEQNLQVTYFLAIALYHQCLNASKEPEALTQLAQRARPYFEILSKSELSEEVAQGFAHLCCLLQDYSKASEIYLDLANKNPESQEEMWFQAALIQSQFDKEKAIQTFDQIVRLGQKKSKEAAYNRLVLSFDVGRYEALTQENRLQDLPEEKVEMAQVFIGKSLHHLKKFPEAIQEFKSFILQASPSSLLHSALLSMADAAYQINDLAALDLALEKMKIHYPQDPELPKVYFSRAQILKKNQNLPDARNQLEQILAQFPQSPQKAQALFELTHLEYKTKAWDSCYQKTRHFLSEFPEHELASFVWKYLVSCSAEMARENPSLKKQLVVDLETYLNQSHSTPEKEEWQLLLAQAYYEMGSYEKAMSQLQTLKSPNARLLLSLCYRESLNDLEQFCQLAESALKEGANLIDPAQIHASLFNALLERSQIDSAAEHLFAAFVAKAPIKTENLLWLANYFYDRLQEEPTHFVFASRVEKILQACLQEAPETLSKLAKVYTVLGRVDEAIALLETVQEPQGEALLLLAECYAKKGVAEKAIEMFDSIVASSASVKNPVSASASLQGTRLKLTTDHPDLIKIATQLKTLVVQKNLESEPLHLEAALDYVDLQSKLDPGKRLALLMKTKHDFETQDDLLSKDYHEARSRSPLKNKIYKGYMQLIEAQILQAQAKLDPQNQKDLQAKSKGLLLQIIEEQTATALLERAQTILNEAKT